MTTCLHRACFVFDEALHRSTVFTTVHRAARWGAHLARHGAHTIREVLRTIFDAVANKARGWWNILADALAHGSTNMQAMLQAISAAMKGQNPLRAGLKAAVSGLSTQTKVLLVVAVVLTLLLGPVLLVLGLLAGIIAGIVAAVRAATRTPAGT